jgi:hypothetical protein
MYFPVGILGGVLAMLGMSLLSGPVSGPEKNLPHPWLLFGYVFVLGAIISGLILYSVKKARELSKTYDDWGRMSEFYDAFCPVMTLQSEVTRRLTEKAVAYQRIVAKMKSFKLGGLQALGMPQENFDLVLKELNDDQGNNMSEFIWLKKLASDYEHLVEVREGGYQAYLPPGVVDEIYVPEGRAMS